MSNPLFKTEVTPLNELGLPRVRSHSGQVHYKLMPLYRHGLCGITTTDLPQANDQKATCSICLDLAAVIANATAERVVMENGKPVPADPPGVDAAALAAALLADPRCTLTLARSSQGTISFEFVTFPLGRIDIEISSPHFEDLLFGVHGRECKVTRAIPTRKPAL